VHCLTRAIWVAADQAMFEKLDSVTVRDILNDGQNCLAKKEAAKAKQLTVLTGAGEAPASQGQRKKVARRVFRQRVAQFTSQQKVRPAGSPKLVMVVDDDPDIVDYLVSIFRGRGYATCSASGGAEAMELLQHQAPDLITLDLEMPDEWGPKFHQKFMKMPEHRDIPVVVVSGLPGIHRAIPKAVATVCKPFEPLEVLRIVEETIGEP
jgi:CheY-like chemotaxis protein